MRAETWLWVLKKFCDGFCAGICVCAIVVGPFIWGLICFVGFGWLLGLCEGFEGCS